MDRDDLRLAIGIGRSFGGWMGCGWIWACVKIFGEKDSLLKALIFIAGIP
jgi:hypothetical protein